MRNCLNGLYYTTHNTLQRVRFNRQALFMVQLIFILRFIV
jgi:hypothetical protein